MGKEEINLDDFNLSKTQTFKLLEVNFVCGLKSSHNYF